MASKKQSDLEKSIHDEFERYSKRKASVLIPAYEEPSYNPNTGTLNNAKYYEKTASERCLTGFLFNKLSAANFSGQIATQEFLVIPLSRVKQVPKTSNQLQALSGRFKNIKHTIRRPDFFCEKYGFAIEVDGSVHDNLDSCIHRDNTREAEYALLGIQLFVIQNYQISDDLARNRVLNEIIRFISTEEANPGFRKQYQTRRTAIHRAKKSYIATDDSIDIGTSTTKTKASSHSGRRISRQWGGQRFHFHPKKPSKSNR
jgi:very-short-patch-repair endonuclease